MVNRPLQLTLWILFLINLLQVIAVIFADIFQCTPISCTFLAADPISPPPQTFCTCINRSAFFISASTLNISLDVWLLVIPTGLVWYMSLALTKKLMVVAILSFGIMCVGNINRTGTLYNYPTNDVCVSSATILGVIRVVFLSTQLPSPSLNAQYNIDIISFVEINVAVWTAAVPALKEMVIQCYTKISECFRS